MCDNNAAVKTSKDNSTNKRTQHSCKRNCFYINKQIHRCCLDIEWVPSQQQLADIMTKALGPMPFERILASLNMLSPG
jgi:hypothetical protein